MISRLHLNSFYCPVMSSKEKESELLGHSLWSAIRCQRKATFNPKRIYRRAQDVHRRAIIVSVSSFPRRKFIVSFLELAVKSSTGGYKSLPLFPFPETRSPFPVRLCAAVSTSTLSVSLSLSLSLSLRLALSARIAASLFTLLRDLAQTETGGASGEGAFNSAAESRIVRYAKRTCVHTRRLIIQINEGPRFAAEPIDRSIG